MKPKAGRGMNMIEVTGLKKVYEMPGVSVKALDGIDLLVEDGEFLAVMGSSGSGKTTLLHMIGGIDTPTCGEVRIDRENVHGMKPSGQAQFRRRKVGIIYQAYNLIPTLTVEENIVLPILLDKRIPRREDVEKLLELLASAGAVVRRAAAEDGYRARAASKAVGASGG